MKIVIASNPFKGTLTAMEASSCIEQGMKKVFPNADFVKIPVADGGDGTVYSLVDATKGKLVMVPVKDPLGRTISAPFGILGDGTTAVIEMACASGLRLLKKQEYNPLITSTFGTGELILHALSSGVSRIILGIGGSATVDGGAGMAQALGIRLLDKKGNDLPRGGKALADLDRIDTSLIDPRIGKTEFIVACDVNNPLLGTHGAAAIYGPQKGATPKMVETLEKSLTRFARVLYETTGEDVSSIPGTGAAGGLGAALVAFFRAKLQSGFGIVAEITRVEEAIQSAQLVITGEGQLDYHTAFGKSPVGVSKIAKKYGIPVIAIAGSLGENFHQLYEHGISACFSALEKPRTDDEIARFCVPMLTDCSEQVARTLELGMRLQK